MKDFENIEGDFSKYDQNIVRNIVEYLSKDVSTPPLYKVHMKIPDQKSMPLAEFLLDDIFHQSAKKIKTIIELSRTSGSIYCGTFTRDVAETKLSEVNKYSDDAQLPIECLMLKEEDDAIKKS